jgi:hypothetical protein
LGRRLRQRTASLDLKRGNIWQFGGGRGDARPIFDGNVARLAGAARSTSAARSASARVACPIFDGRLLRHGDTSENENCMPLLRSEAHIAFVFKVNRASRIERVGIENFLILFATRAAYRLIAGRFDDPDR